MLFDLQIKIRSRQDVFTEEYFWMCIKYNQFPFVIQVSKDEMGYVANKNRMHKNNDLQE